MRQNIKQIGIFIILRKKKKSNEQQKGISTVDLVKLYMSNSLNKENTKPSSPQFS